MTSYFPHLTSTGRAPTIDEIHLKYRQAFIHQVSDGVRRPLVFPCHFLGIFLVAAYLCIPHKQNSIIYAARWPLVVLTTCFELYIIRESWGSGPDCFCFAGLIAALTIMSSWTWLILKRPQWDAKRVERRRVRAVRDAKNTQLTEKAASNGQSCQEKLENGSVLLHHVGCGEISTDNGEIYEYFWQSYPDNLSERFSWVVDLITSARGPGWDWAISSIPSLTPENLRKFSESVEEESPFISAKEKKRFSARSQHLLYELSIYICSYFVVDVLRTIMMYDPYFKFGPTTYELPFYLQNLHPYTLQFYRLLLTSVTLIIAMRHSFSQCQIFYPHVLGPRVLGLRGEHWYYPGIWGEFSNTLHRGLNGLWGGTWHQTFRLYFTAPTKYLLQKAYIKPDTYIAKATGLFFAFGLSGFLHWAGSMTSFSPAYPTQQFIFFGLQGLGIALQDGLCILLSPIIAKLPKYICYTGNLLYTLTWLYFTGWLAADDFARCGMWLVEPVYFSPMQALGFGEHEAGWHRWRYYDLVWYTGNHWWESGFTLI